MDDIEGPITPIDMEGVALMFMTLGNYRRADDIACEMFRWYAHQYAPQLPHTASTYASPTMELAILRSRWWLGFMAASGAAAAAAGR